MIGFIAGYDQCAMRCFGRILIMNMKAYKDLLTRDLLRKTREWVLATQQRGAYAETVPCHPARQ
jgi:hypothetical protein